jgi:purine nucleoside phosphorylase
MDAATVSMSPAAEMRAAKEEGQAVVVLVVVANSGSTTHSEVLDAVARANNGVFQVVSVLAETWT